MELKPAKANLAKAGLDKLLIEPYGIETVVELP